MNKAYTSKDLKHKLNRSYWSLLPNPFRIKFFLLNIFVVWKSFHHHLCYSHFSNFNCTQLVYYLQKFCDTFPNAILVRWPSCFIPLIILFYVALNCYFFNGKFKLKLKTSKPREGYFLNRVEKLDFSFKIVKTNIKFGFLYKWTFVFGILIWLRKKTSQMNNCLNIFTN